MKKERLARPFFLYDMYLSIPFAKFCAHFGIFHAACRQKDGDVIQQVRRLVDYPFLFRVLDAITNSTASSPTFLPILSTPRANKKLVYPPSSGFF